jgi:uncharacterized integral membrane protein
LTAHHEREEGCDHDDGPFLLASRRGPAETTTSEAGSSPTRRAPRVTRASAAWVATGVALLLLILLIVFILQNSTKVEVQFLGMSGTIPLGMALLIAAVGGGVVVAIAGVARVTQLRMNARRTRQSTSSH